MYCTSYGGILVDNDQLGSFKQRMGREQLWRSEVKWLRKYMNVQSNTACNIDKDYLCKCDAIWVVMKI